MAVTGWVPPWSDDPQIFAAWGQWAGGIGSLLAVIVALAAAFTEGRRRRREEADRRAAQARTITATVAPVKGPGAKNRYPAVLVENHGQLPITDIVIRDVQARHGDTRLTKWEIRQPNGGNHDDQSPYDLAAVIGPGDEQISSQLVFADNAEGVTRIAFTNTSVRFSFLDAEGLRWERNGNRAPVRLLDKREAQIQELRFRGRLFLYMSSPILLAALILGEALGNPSVVQVMAVVCWLVNLIVAYGGVRGPTRKPR